MKRDTPSSSSSSSSSNTSSSRKKANVKIKVDLTTALPRQVSDEFLDKIKHATRSSQIDIEHIFIEKEIPSQLGPVTTEATNLDRAIAMRGKPKSFSFNRREMTKKLSAEFWSTEMYYNADSYLEGCGRWDYSHKPITEEVNIDDIDHIVLRAKISGGRGVVWEKSKEKAWLGLGTFPSCENDLMQFKIIRVPEGFDFTWFLSETGRAEVHKSLNELYNWLNTARICKKEKKDAKLRQGNHYLNDSWSCQKTWEYDLTNSLVTCDPPIAVYCGRAAIPGQTFCTKCFCDAEMSDKL